MIVKTKINQTQANESNRKVLITSKSKNRTKRTEIAFFQMTEIAAGELIVNSKSTIVIIGENGSQCPAEVRSRRNKLNKQINK